MNLDPKQFRAEQARRERIAAIANSAAVTTDQLVRHAGLAWRVQLEQIRALPERSHA